MFNDISCAFPVTVKAMKKNVWQMSESSKYLQRSLVLDNGHSLVQVLKRSCFLERIAHKELGTKSRTKVGIRRKRMSNFSCNHSIVQGYSQEQRTWKIVNALHCRLSNNWGSFSHANQLSLYGAAATFCEEFEIHQDGSGEPDVLMGQSIVLGEIKAEILLQNENSLNHQILWQQYMERIELLSQENKVSKLCLDAGFTHVVEIGQYFLT